MPTGLTATVEVLASDCCSGSASVALIREGILTECDGAADTTWYAYDLLDPAPPEIIICSGTAPGFPPYPTKIAIANLELICGSAEDLCGDASGSMSGSISVSDPGSSGPPFSLRVSYYNSYTGVGEVGSTLATQDLVVSCCTPLYLQFDITIPVCFIAGAGVIVASTTLRITITE
jgi:hypothetical protein